MTTRMLRVFRCVFVACLALCAGEASAHHSRPTRLFGIVESIDPVKHLLTVKPQESGKPLQFKWGPWTTFAKDGAITSAAALGRGPAEIFYRVPFFGGPTLEKIVWQSNPGAGAH